MKKSRKFLSFVLALLMLVSCVSIETMKVSAESQRDAIVRIALAEEGVSGCPNKYTYAYGQIGGTYNWAWCAAFIYWCAQQAGIPHSIIGRTASASVNSFNTPYYSYSSSSNVQKGDILYLVNNYGNHVGLVYAVDSNYIYTIEGNMGNAVKKYKYRRSDGYITWSSASQWQRITYFGVPNYENATSTSLSLKLNNSSNNISNTNDVLFAWSNISGNYHGYNLFVAKNIEGTVNYDWDNSRIYLPGLETVSYTAESTTLPAGAYAAYIEGINITNGQKSQASNFIYFTVYDEIISDFHEPYNNVTIDVSKNKSLIVRGWAVNTGKKETKCYATIDGGGQKLLKAVARNDVYSSALYSSYCFSNMVGFEDYINIENLSSGKHNLKVIARSSTATKEVASIEFTIFKPSYTVSFNTNGGSSSTKSKTVIYSGTYGTLPTPTRAGYTFDGWYTSATGGTKVTSSTKVTATSNHTLYAHWTCNHSSTELRNAKTATCTAVGFTGDTYCITCSAKLKSGSEIYKLSHSDTNSDYKCDYGCGYDFEKPAPDTPTTPDNTEDIKKDCSCNCHKGGISGFFFKLINFFQKIFGINKVCACGVKH